MTTRVSRSIAATVIGMLVVPACLLIKPLDEAREAGQGGSDGVSGDAGAGVGGGNMGGKAGKAGSSAGGDATGGNMSAGTGGKATAGSGGAAGGSGPGDGGETSGGSSACESADGTCQADAPAGWSGPALMNANCGPTPSLRAGTGFAASQPQCSYTALASNCAGTLSIAFHSNAGCTAPVDSYTAQAAGECDLSPGISPDSHYKVTGLPVAPCTTATPPPASTYDNPATFCEQSESCPGGETCTPSGNGQICIWTMTNPAQCPAPYTVGPTTLVVGTPVCPNSAQSMGTCEAELHLGSLQNCSASAADLSLDQAAGCVAKGIPAPIQSALLEYVAPNGCQGAASTAMKTGDVYVCCLPAK